MTAPLVTILDDEPEIRAILADALQACGVSFAECAEYPAKKAAETFLYNVVGNR